MMYVYVIKGKYIGCAWEDIDEFDTLDEARKMLGEYAAAFGSGWQYKILRRRSAS